MASLTEEQSAYVADRARIWEVRRFCQVLPSATQYVRGKGTLSGITPLEAQTQQQPNVEANGALASMLKCIVHEVEADIAMVCLLDDRTQYFVSGSDLPNLHDARVTIESTKWYGCDSVTHHGGLCERTITMKHAAAEPPCLEVLDLANEERTKDLPFVNGTIASFRHYFGVPICPYNGYNVGTVFFFCKEPSVSGLSADKRSYMFEMSQHITKCLERSVEALEGKRMLNFNQGIAALMSTNGEGSLAKPEVSASTHEQVVVSNQHPSPILRVYQLAAEVLGGIFRFDGVRIEEAGLPEDSINQNPNWNGSNLLAQHVRTGFREHMMPPSSLIQLLLEMVPSGGVFQLIRESRDVTISTPTDGVTLIADNDLVSNILKAFPNTEQIMLMPLWDTHHERNTGTIIGFAQDLLNVHLGPADLSSMSAFCATLMMQVRRLEVQAVDKVKSDFLGSISHELRTPLHGILASLELLSDTSCTKEQLDLLETARYGGISLLDTINQVLDYSNISDDAKRSSATSKDEANKPPLSQKSSYTHSVHESLPAGTEHMNILEACDDIIQRQVQMVRLKEAVGPMSPRETPADFETAVNSSEASSDQPAFPLLTFDTNASAWSPIPATGGFRVAFANLLSNALKFTEPTRCVRVSLDVDESTVRLSIVDAGKGMSLDFVRRHLSGAFSQEDPINEGIGLGFFLAKRAITSLGGDVHVASDRSLGTNVTASFPVGRLMGVSSSELQSKSSIAADLNGEKLPEIKTAFLVPQRWKTGDLTRGRRCTEVLLASFARGSEQRVRTDIVVWDESKGDLDLLVTLNEDFDRSSQIVSNSSSPVRQIVLCPRKENDFEDRVICEQGVARVFEPVTSSNIHRALKLLDLDAALKLKSPTNQTTGVVDFSTTDEPPHQSNGATPQQPAKQSPEPTPPPKPQENRPDPLTPPPSNEPPPTSLALPTRHEPRTLLVDDNAINLKVLERYLLKSTSQPPLCAPGGQAAIEAFGDSFLHPPPTSSSSSMPAPGAGSIAPQRFDIIFLDLSMPGVSGFEVAASIRETEALVGSRRTFICALTGLVSAKDRNRAFAAGVDEYLVKPARLGDVRGVVERWRAGVGAGG